MGVGHFKMIIKWSRGWFFSQVYRGWLFPKDLTKLPGDSALTMVLGLTIPLILSARRQYLHMQQSSSRHFVWQFFSRLQWNQVQMLWNDWGWVSSGRFYQWDFSMNEPIQRHCFYFYALWNARKLLVFSQFQGCSDGTLA